MNVEETSFSFLRRCSMPKAKKKKGDYVGKKNWPATKNCYFKKYMYLKCMFYIQA